MHGPRGCPSGYANDDVFTTSQLLYGLRKIDGQGYLDLITMTAFLEIRFQTGQSPGQSTVTLID